MYIFCTFLFFFFFFSSRRRHTRYIGDWSSDVCSSDLRSVVVTRHTPSTILVVIFGKSQEAASARGTARKGMATKRHKKRSEERRVGKECRSRWSQDQ